MSEEKKPIRKLDPIEAYYIISEQLKLYAKKRELSLSDKSLIREVSKDLYRTMRHLPLRFVIFRDLLKDKVKVFIKKIKKIPGGIKKNVKKT